MPAAPIDVIFTRCPAHPNAAHITVPLGLVEQMTADLPCVRMHERIGGDTHHKGFDFWLRQAGYAKSLGARIAGADTRLVAASLHERVCPIWVRADSPAASARDLAGLRLGLLEVAGAPFPFDRLQYFQIYDAALRSAGLGFDDVEFVDVVVDGARIKADVDTNYVDLRDPAHRNPSGQNIFTEFAKAYLTALQQHQVDAIATNLPDAVAEFYNLRKIYDSRKDSEADQRYDMRILTVNGALLRQHREVVVRVLAAELEAGRWSLAHAGQTEALLARDLQISRSTLRFDCEDFPSAMQIDAGARMQGFLEDKQELLLRHGYLQGRCDIGAWLDPGPLQEARAWLASRQPGTASLPPG